MLFDACTCFAFCLSQRYEMQQKGADAVLRGSLLAVFWPSSGRLPHQCLSTCSLKLAERGLRDLLPAPAIYLV